MPSLIVVSNRLPVTVGRTIEKSSGGMVSALEGLGDNYDFQWIGWAGGVVQSPRRREEIWAELRQRFNFTALFLSREDARDYYTGFSNSSLWPLLHYMPSKMRYRERWAESYRAVNRRFAEAVLERAHDGDVVWIQDYHLMLLPAMLRRERPEMTIGFFLHTPFPSYEVFRCHPNREELLEGMLGADRIGFHTFGYLRHFRSTVLRLLGTESEIDVIPHESNPTGIGVYPIGINAEKFRTCLGTPDCAKYRAALEEAYAGKKVVLSVERLDYTKGVLRRLDAVERFLAETGRKDVVFISVCVPSRESVPEYQELRRAVEIKISQINGKHSTLKDIPAHFIHRPVTFEELCALYAVADVAIVTPLVDGMNLVAKEFLLCQQKDAGALILSEFAGAAQELPHAYLVNPYDTRQIRNALQDALDAPVEDRRRRIAPMKERVSKYDARFWAASFIEALQTPLPGAPETVRTRPLSLEAVCAHLTGERKALFLDYDGTLAEFRKRPEDAVPTGAVGHLLFLLGRRQDLEVFLVGGRSREEMERWFSGYRLHLVAEHGYCWRERDSGRWVRLAPDADLSWKEQIRDYLKLYAGLTPGAFLEEKTASLVWHYAAADPEFGLWKAHQLVSELQEMLSNLPVEIRHGRQIVEVGSMHVSKGAAVVRLMAEKDLGAVLCAGDDETDETMFRLSDARIVSVRVGQPGDTAARFRIQSPRAFRVFLERFLEETAPSQNPSQAVVP
jgi:trehalose 6-phosphate synthase/phosphatase